MIETQEYKNFAGFSGDDHKVGVSKPLSELTAEEIINYDKYLCGEINKYVNVSYVGQIPQISLPESADNKPMFSTNVSWSDTFWCNQPPKKDLYMRTLLLNVPNNKRDREYTFTVQDNNVRIVTELTDFQDMYITTKIGKPDGAPHSSKTEAGTVETGKVSGIVKNMLTDTSYITPVWVITDGTNLWITSGVIYHSYYVNFNNNLTNQGFNSGIPDFNNNKSNSLSFGINPNLTSEPVKCTDILPESEKPYTVNVNDKTFGIMITYGGSNYQPRGKFWFNNNIDENTTPFGDGNQFIDITAYYGMYMRSAIKNSNNEYVWYKPIITGGMVNGYTTDMNAKSDIDDWEILDNHNIPIIPPSPGGDDNSDSVDFGGIYGGGGAFARFYIMNATELANLRSWMNGVQLEGGDKIPMGLDPMGQIISLSEFPVDISSSGLAPEDIVFRTINVPQDAFGPDVPIPATVNTGVSAVRATGGTIELDLGTVEIPRYWQSREVPFLDYETSIECYIPFCGVFGLDCQAVMGKTLGAKLYLATATGACNCIVYTNANGTLNPVAYGSGNMSAQLPISSNQWGTLVAATYEQRMSIAQAQSNTAANLGSVLMGGLLGTVSGTDMSFGEHVLMGQNIFGSASKAGQSSGSVHIQKQLARNKLQAIGTTFSSAFGTTAAWSLPFKAYIKITRPNAQIPDNYAHTEGIPQVKTKILGDCQGLTICVNTDITSINATLQEKNMIVEALSNGVIV